MKKDVIVVGAGIGGLATALRLAKAGYNVRILEKNSQAGGRLNCIKNNGFTFDTGPSFFSMSYEFEQFAKDCGIKVPFKYYPLEPLYTVNFSGNPNTFYIYKDVGRLSEQFTQIEPNFEKKFIKYLKKSERIFNDTIDLVIKRNFDSVLSYVISLMKVNPIHFPLLFKSFWEEVVKNFSSKEARQIISLVAFFLGRTPFDTNSVYTLLSYVEFKHDGYYNVKGGMYKIVEGLVEELKKEKVKFYYNTEIVDFIRNQNIIESLIDQNGSKWSSEIFVVNSDAAYFRNKVFRSKLYSEDRLNNMIWTMGYLTFYIGLKCKLSHVYHHNYYLGTNYEDYAKNIIQDPNSLQKPYYYVNLLSKHNKECAPEGCESLFFVCPVPNLQYKINWDDKEEIVNNILKDFCKRINQNIFPEIVTKTIFTPIDWQNKFNLYAGSGLGLAHYMNQIGAFRPPNFDEQYKNVFYVGASTIPGAGIPMAIISSKLAFERVNNYCVLT